MAKRIISGVMLLVMLISAFPVAIFAQQPATDISVSSGNLQVSNTNSFGALISNEINEEQRTSAQEKEQFEGGYSVTELTISGQTAKVTYASMEEATLIVALYTEDGLQMLRSAATSVTADDTTATVTFTESLPRYFRATAYLVDTYDLSPLCPAFETPMYTKDMQDLLASSVDDYDSDRVLNLDENEQTNFAVYADATKVIEPVEGYNTVSGINEEKSTYVITNADSQFRNLKKGEIVAYNYAEESLLLVKVSAVTVKGTTVTIVGDELDVHEVFSYVKMENIGQGKDFVVDESQPVEGLTIEGYEEDPGASTYSRRSNTSSGYVSAGLKLKYSTTIASVGNTKVDFSLSGGLKVKASVEFYVAKDKQYMDLKVTTEFSGSVDVSGKVKTSFKLLPMQYTVFGISVGFKPEFVAEFSGSVKLEFTFKYNVGYTYEKGVGLKDNSSRPKFDTKLKISGKLFIGFDMKPQIAVFGGILVETSASMPIGFELSGSLKGSNHENFKPGSKERHTCQSCIAFDISFKASVSIKLAFLKSKKLTFTTDVVEFKATLGQMYWSLDNEEFGLGSCPHREYLVTILVEGKDHTPLNNREVKRDGKSLGNTDEKGLITVYLPKGEYQFSATISGEELKCLIDVKEACKVILSSEGTMGKISVTGGILGTQNADDFMNRNYLYSGYCGDQGDNVRWEYCENGDLVISGNGRMMDYDWLNDVPWNECYGIERVIVKNGVTHIGAEAFAYEYWLREVILPEGLISIGSSAFSSLQNLTKVNLPSSIREIGSNAFSGCAQLSEVTLPGNVQKVGSYAFDLCDLKTLHIPASLTQIGNGAFTRNENLERITVAKENGVYWAEGNILYSRYDILVAAAKGAAGHIVVPDTVSSIDDYAFRNCSGITGVELPDLLYSIGYMAFAYCDNLVSVNIPEWTESIEENAFAGCAKLTQIELSEFNESFVYTNGILYSADMTQLVATATTSVKGNVVIPETVQELPSYAFYYCSNMTGVQIPAGVERIPWACFSNCIKLTSVFIPASVTELENYAFQYCAFSQITIPDRVEEIPDYCFRGCDNLQAVVIPGSVSEVGVYAFSSCDSLKKLTIEEGVKSLGVACFYECTSLERVVIPATVEKIGVALFKYCSNLSEIYFCGDVPTPVYAEVLELWHPVLETVKATAYYPIGNEGWERGGGTSFGGEIVWVAFNPATLTTVAADQPAAVDTPLLEMELIPPQELTVETPAVGAVYGGEYEKQPQEQGTAYIASFRGLVPNEQYLMLALRKINTDALLDKGNILFVSQGIAMEDGTLSFRYIQKTEYDVTYVMACGASSKNLKDAQITFPGMGAADTLSAVDPTVIYDGKELQEGRDYILTGETAYMEAGTHTCFVRGIRDYAGLVECHYTVANKLVNSIIINPDKLMVESGSTVQLSAKVMPADADNTEVIWMSDDETIATVSVDGLVTVVGGGPVRIRAVAADGSGVAGICELFATGIVSGSWGDAKWTLDERTQTLRIYGTEEIIFSGDQCPWEEYIDQVKYVVVEEGVKELGSYLFEGHYEMESIFLPASLEILDETALIYSGLQSISVAEGSQTYKTVDGVLFSKNGETLVKYPEGRTDKTYQIPAGTKVLGERAFAFSELESMTVPEGVTTIREMAFFNCYEMRSLHLPATLTDCSNDAYSACYSMESVTVARGNSVYSTLDNCLTNKERTQLYAAPPSASGRYEIPDEIRHISTAAFSGNMDITEIILPQNLERIDSESFVECWELKKVYFTGDAPAFGEDVFFYMEIAVYYPENNDTWTEEVLQDYGGWPQWQAYSSLDNGDMNDDGQINDADAMYLLRFTLFPSRYPIVQNGDVNADGTINDADAMYLLRFTLFPSRYPLYPN